MGHFKPPQQFGKSKSCPPCSQLNDELSSKLKAHPNIYCKRTVRRISIDTNSRHTSTTDLDRLLPNSDRLLTIFDSSLQRTVQCSCRSRDMAGIASIYACPEYLHTNVLVNVRLKRT